MLIKHLAKLTFQVSSEFILKYRTAPSRDSSLALTLGGAAVYSKELLSMYSPLFIFLAVAPYECTDLRAGYQSEQHILLEHNTDHHITNLSETEAHPVSQKSLKP